MDCLQELLTTSDRKECICEIVIMGDTVIAIFIIYVIVNVIECLILTSNISVNYVHIFLKLNKIIIS